MKTTLVGLMIVAAVAVFLVSYCAQGVAQVSIGGEQQQRDTTLTVSKTKQFDATGKETGEKTVSHNTSNPTGKYEYSGLPCKWFRGTGGGGGGKEEKGKGKE